MQKEKLHQYLKQQSACSFAVKSLYLPTVARSPHQLPSQCRPEHLPRLERTESFPALLLAALQFLSHESASLHQLMLKCQKNIKNKILFVVGCSKHLWGINRNKLIRTLNYYKFNYNGVFILSPTYSARKPLKLQKAL